MKMKKATQKLAALAQETRLSVFRLLVEAGESGLSAGEIAETLDVPAPTLSFHLAQLTEAALLVRSRKSRSIIYAVDFDGVQGLLRYLMADCCQGQPELCGIVLEAEEPYSATAR